MATKKKVSSPAKSKGASKAKAAKGQPARKRAPVKAKPARKKPGKKPVPQVEAAPSGPPENPRAHALARKVAKLMLDKKALDVLILDVRGKASYTDYFVIASGESDRQVSAIAEHVSTTL